MLQGFSDIQLAAHLIPMAYFFKLALKSIIIIELPQLKVLGVLNGMPFCFDISNTRSPAAKAGSNHVFKG